MKPSLLVPFLQEASTLPAKNMIFFSWRGHDHEIAMGKPDCPVIIVSMWLEDSEVFANDYLPNISTCPFTGSIVNVQNELDYPIDS